MSDKEKTQSSIHNEKRRKVVRNILASASVASVADAGLEKSWSKPIISSVVLPSHAATTDQGEEPQGLRCCPYYFDATQSWCYDDGADQNGNTGPVPGGFSEFNWVQPDNCPTPET